MKLFIILGLLVGLASCSIQENPKEEPKYICTKSHMESKIEYGYGFTLTGKLGWGMITVQEYICDKEELNPKYTGE